MIKCWKHGPVDIPCITCDCSHPRMPITVLELALAEGAKKEPDGSISCHELVIRGLPILPGCEICHSSLGPGNAYPSTTGFIRCYDCLGDLGFESAKDFEAAKGEINEDP